jgi:uncharacterized membrane protein
MDAGGAHAPHPHRLGAQVMPLEFLTVARAVHVLALVHWIGGVSIVTTIVLPYANRLTDPEAALEAFETFEHRFAAQARVSILLAGLSGLYMVFVLDAWSRFSDPSFWWLHLMVAVWLLFAVMVYGLEPLFLHERFRKFALQDQKRAFGLATRLHAIALTVSAVAIAAGVLGAHGALY